MYNYNYYPQQNQTQNSLAQQPPQNMYMRQTPYYMGLKGRPVASLEEARASSIDFDGSVFYFPDIANHCIYTKQINIDGTATLCVYELSTTPIENNSTQNFITREEFDTVISQLKSTLIPANDTPAANPQTKRMEVMSF